MRLAAWPPGACGAPSSAPPPRAWFLKMDDQLPCAAGRRGAPWFERASLRCAGPSGDVRRGRGPRARALWRSVCEALPVLQVGVRVLGRLRSVLALRGPGTRAARERLLPAAGRPSPAGGSFAAGASLCRDGPSVSSRCPCSGCHVQHSVAQSDAGECASCVFLQESYGFTAHSHAVNAARVHFCTFCVFECISITGSSVRTAAAAARCSLLSITVHRDGLQLSTRRGFPCDFSVPCDLAPPCSFYLHVFMLHDIFT